MLFSIYLVEKHMRSFLRRIKLLLWFLKENSKPKPQPPFLIETKQQIISKGKESYHNGNFIVKGKGGMLEIGSFCAIGADVKVILANHDFSKISMQYTFHEKYLNLNITPREKQITVIENDVWIGDNSILLPGITVGTGAVIGAGAIVTKDVPPYTIVAGNPAKIIRKRFSDEKIQELLATKWWEWDDEKIKENKSFFMS